MPALVKNRILDALLKTVLFSAFSHLGILAYDAVKNMDLQRWNIFGILELDLIWPALTKGPVAMVISQVFIIAVYAIFFALSRQREDLAVAKVISFPSIRDQDKIAS